MSVLLITVCYYQSNDCHGNYICGMLDPTYIATQHVFTVVHMLVKNRLSSRKTMISQKYVNVFDVKFCEK